MRTRWDEVDEVNGSVRRIMGLTPITWAMAVPVAFIAGAAIMSYFDQARAPSDALKIPAPAVAGNTVSKSGNDARLAAERAKWEAEAKGAEAEAGELRMQLEAMRDQMSDEIRRRNQAEQKANELANREPASTTSDKRPGSATTGVNAEMPAQEALSYANADRNSGPSSDAAQRMQSATVTQAATAAPTPSHTEQPVSIQKIIEETASRSAAQSDRIEDIEVSSTSNVAQNFDAKAPRKDADVESALSRATGLDTLSSSERGSLKSSLVSGECVANSLEKVMGKPVPVVPLRNLVRDLNSNC